MRDVMCGFPSGAWLAHMHSGCCTTWVCAPVADDMRTGTEGTDVDIAGGDMLSAPFIPAVFAEGTVGRRPR